MFYYKLDNKYIGSILHSLQPTNNKKDALSVRKKDNALSFLKFLLSLSNNNRYQYIISNLDQIKIVNNNNEEIEVEDNSEIYAIYCLTNNELQSANILKTFVDSNNFNSKKTMISKKIIDSDFKLSDYITDIMFPHSFDINLHRYKTDINNYFYIQVKKTSLQFFNDVIKKIILSVPGVLGIVGTKIETKYYKKQIFRKNKREVVKNNKIFYIDPSPINNKDLEKVSSSQNNFSLYNDSYEFSIGDKVYYWRLNRKKKKIFIPVTITGIKDSITYQVETNNKEKNYVTIDQLCKEKE